MSEGRRAAAVLLIGVALGLAAAVFAAARDQRSLAFANGVGVLRSVAVLEPGEQACQLRVVAIAPFASVSFAADTAATTGPALEVGVRDSASGRRLGSGHVAGGYVAALDSPASYPRATVGAIRGEEQEVDVCIRNRGQAPVMLGGDSDGEVGDSRLVWAGIQRTGGLALAFGRESPTTLLAQLPLALDRAALFHPPLLGAWTLWVLAALVAFAAPVALAAAVAAAARSDTS